MLPVKIPMKIAGFLCVLTCSLALAQPPTELFEDTEFLRGFNVVSSPKGPGKLDFGLAEEDALPFWTLAPLNSRFDLLNASLKKFDDGSCEFKDPTKTVRLYRNEQKEQVLRLDLCTEQEYLRPRKLNEPWPHLLILHDYSPGESVQIAQTEDLIFSMDVRVRKCDNLMKPEDYDSALHCGQATPYFVFANRNPNSEDFNDYIWFGVPLFDSRTEVQPPYAALDGDPKILGTGKLIYVLDGATVISENYGGINPFFGEWAHLEIDLCDSVEEALKRAHAMGLLTKTTMADLAFTHFNLGWEVTGTFDCSLEIKNLRMSCRMANETGGHE
ncbi:MAG: hypothetical protein Q4G68_05400 [Planctomycetia bacterium]|nr:hypothetical protein [Planctomycetia bacterium]